jgi:hypothetical protein
LLQWVASASPVVRQSFVLDCANDRREYGAASAPGDRLLDDPARRSDLLGQIVTALLPSILRTRPKHRIALIALGEESPLAYLSIMPFACSPSSWLDSRCLQRKEVVSDDWETNMEQILINLIAGALGGVGAVKASPTLDLGMIGNVISGLVGGGVT